MLCWIMHRAATLGHQRKPINRAWDDRQQISNVGVSPSWFSGWINIIKLRKKCRPSLLCHCVHCYISLYIWHDVHNRSLLVLTGGVPLFSLQDGYVDIPISTAFNSAHRDDAFPWSWVMHLLLMHWGYSDCILYVMTDCILEFRWRELPPLLSHLGYWFVLVCCSFLLVVWCRNQVFHGHVLIALS